MASSDLITTSGLMKDYGEDENGDFYVDVVGIPFGGPAYLGNRDLDGEYFDKETDIGPLEVGLSYFSHAKDPYFGKDLIGLAHKKGLSEEEGWIYRVIVDKRHKYLNLLKTLAKERLLGASSTPHQRSAEKDANGHWKRWHWFEVALTPVPNNPLADQIIEKELGEELEMAKANASTKEKEAEVTPAQETPAETPAVEEKQETPAESLSEQLEKAFDEVTNEKDADTEETVTISKADFEKLVADVSALKNDQANLGKSLEKSLGEIKTALPTLGTLIAKTLKGQVIEDARKSAPERHAEKSLNTQQQPNRSNSKLPANAPGNR